jgi:LysM repeat protein
MNAQKQRKNTAAAVAIIVLILLVVLGIGLYFLFNKPTPPAAPMATPAPMAAPAAPEPAPVAAPVPAAPKMLGTHTVIPKDTLWWISDKWYKDPVLWPSIYEINKAEIQDPDRIFPGQKFDIPALTGTSASLSPDDKSLLAQGYLEAYRVYKEKGKKDAEDYKIVGDKLNAAAGK